MIALESNISEIFGDIRARVSGIIENPDPVLRAMALGVLPELRERVHVKGLDSSGSPIGTYSPEYMVVRTGGYKNSGRISRGPNKGKLKDSGKYTKGADLGSARKRYNRTADPKVILSLTRQMEQDLSVIDTPTGYGIGYLNPFNFEKAKWCEQTYHKPILTELTTEEKDLAERIKNNFFDDFFNVP